jgi:ribosomal protein S6--L-glutamate ligase
LTTVAEGAGRAFLVGTKHNETNGRLAADWRSLGIDVEIVLPWVARELMQVGDIAIGRLDVTPTLDGVEPGLFELLLLERAGFVVLNGAAALLNCHDKWRTAKRLELAGLPHPRTVIAAPGQEVDIDLPVVVKPRFGSWGADVERCETADDLARCLGRAESKPWFQRHGALVQELVPSAGYDLRIVVACGVVVGAVRRVARPGEWRTNTSLGGARRPVEPPSEACELAVAAAAAVGADFVGVDLLPWAAVGHTVIELNGAVDFTDEYAVRGHDPFTAAASALRLLRDERASDRRERTTSRRGSGSQ